MTAPGAGPGEGAHDGKADPPAFEQPGAGPAWEPPAPPPLGDYPPPAYPPPGYGAEYGSGYRAPYPPPGYQPPYPPQFGNTYGPAQHPGGHYRAPDYLGAYGPQATSGTNALAIASLVVSFTGVLCCIGSFVAIALGVVGLNQIKETRQEGFGLAVAGIVISVATLVVNVIAMMFMLHSS